MRIRSTHIGVIDAELNLHNVLAISTAISVVRWMLSLWLGRTSVR